MTDYNRRARERFVGDAAGFTIVDMAITLVLLGILLSLGIAALDNSAYRVDASVSQVIQRARVARSLAVLRQHDVILTFDQSNPAVVIHEDANNDGVRDSGERVIRYPLEDGTGFTRSGAPPYGGFNEAVSFSDEDVTFRRDGSCDEEGAVYVNRTVGEGPPRAVVFTRATGYTRIFRYSGSGWVKP